jgi:hypothetical protein
MVNFASFRTLGAGVTFQSDTFGSKGAIRPEAIILPLTAFTLFMSAFLLFSVQPFFAKMVLPRLGGTPAVWSVAMVFFQTVLLAGYGYAHVLSRYLSLKAAVLVHVAVLLIALVALPIAIPESWQRPPADGEALWLIGLFTVSVGLPFFAVSANGPLLQAWFARTGHVHAKDPYFLYGASNIGSFASLILYVILIEPLFDLQHQSALWTGGFVILGVLIAACGYFASRLALADPLGMDAASVAQVHDETSRAQVTWLTRATWIAYAFIPSSLLVAVTAHVSTDVAAAPFLWIVPLALFLLTFVIVFQKKPILKASTVEKILPYALIAAIYFTFNPLFLPISVSLPLHFGAFFLVAMHAHGSMAAIRPSASKLTEFYFAMSIGGVLGGLFAGLLSMHLFSWNAEYPVLLILSLATLTRFRGASLSRMALVTAAVSVGIVALLLVLQKAGVGTFYTNEGSLAVVNGFLLIAAIYALFRVPLVVPALCVAIFANNLVKYSYFNHSLSARSFFGVVRVLDFDDTGVRNFLHGTTLHGAMRLKDLKAPGAPLPLTYYTADGGLNSAIMAARKNDGGLLGNTGIIGVGAGSLTCQMKTGEKIELVEIDPLVMKIASDPAQFRFLSDCAKGAKVTVADGRLALADAPDANFDLLILDAFSSDSIPVHMMTTEAIDLFMRKVKPGGLLVMHISNRHLDLKSVVAANAKALGLVAVTGNFKPQNSAETVNMAMPSIVAVLARQEADFGALLEDKRWLKGDDHGVTAWTDGYSNILQAMWRHYTAG